MWFGRITKVLDPVGNNADESPLPRSNLAFKKIPNDGADDG
jgi:hypothetical protein